MATRSCSRLVILALAPALSLAASTLRAQQPGKVSGRVVDAVSGQPLQSVIVTVVGAELTTRTDDDGRYLIEAVPPGLVKVTAQIIGYHPITTSYYNVFPDSATSVNFRLAPLTVQLDPVEVIGERPEEEFKFGATVITSDQLPARGDILTSLKGVAAGINVTGRNEDTRVTVRRSHASVLFVVDGVVITPPMTFYIDTQEVECVEVRRGYRAAQEFRPSIHGETYSGVILIWTKGSLGRKPPGCKST